MKHRAGSSGKDKEDSCPLSDIEINLNLNPTLCLDVAKGLGLLLLRMDSTCHSDVFLIVCKALARIATACRPVIPLGAIFREEQLIGLLLTAVGSDYVRQKNWSSSWISHAIMCLIQDIVEGEKAFPQSPRHIKAEEMIVETTLGGASSEETGNNRYSASNDGALNGEDMIVDDVDGKCVLGCCCGNSEPFVVIMNFVAFMLKLPFQSWNTQLAWIRGIVTSKTC